MGIIIENYAGAFPLWLAPVQFSVIPVSEKFTEYAKQVTSRLLDAGLRGEADLGPDRVGYKIRSASLQKLPYIIVVGEKEQEAQTINVRSRQAGELGAMKLDAFLDSIAPERLPGGKSAHAQAAE
jgi:threonyl-tRNA synthetase